MEDREEALGRMGVCVVVGGSGWTGSYLIARLILARKQLSSSSSPPLTVHSVDISPPSQEHEPLHLGEDSFHCCDITNAAALLSLFRSLRPKTVFHVASIVDLRLYPSPLIEQVNVHGTRNLIQCLREVTGDDDTTCFVYTSTFDVVSTKHGVIDATESMPYVTNPSNHYKRTKMMAEKEVLLSSREKFLTCALRPGHIFGPGDMLWDIVTNSPVAVGPSTSKMSFTYVENCATAHLLAAISLYKEASSDGGKSCSYTSSGTTINGSAFFISDFDANFCNFYKQLANLKPPMFRLPIFLVSVVISIVELFEKMMYFCFGDAFVKCQFQHPVTGLTSAIIESGEVCTASSKMAEKYLNYFSNHSPYYSCLQVLSREESIGRTMKWGYSRKAQQQ